MKIDNIIMLTNENLRAEHPLAGEARSKREEREKKRTESMKRYVDVSHLEFQAMEVPVAEETQNSEEEDVLSAED